ncbi:hypothetical protein CHS0354_037325, partial [Potamilus streckersoni]
RDNGCSALQNETLTYKNHGIVSEMLASASLICKERVQQRVHASPYAGIIMISEDKRHVPDHGKESKKKH